MADVPARYLEVLKGVCDLPTAPFCEGVVVGWLEGWAKGVGLKSWRDGAGNLYVEYLKGGRSETPLVVEAHMDHPGFLVVGEEGGVVKCEFRGGVKVSYFVGEGVRFWVEKSEDRSEKSEGRWVKGRALEVTQREGGRVMDVQVRCEGEPPPIGSLGMWDLGDAEVDGDFFGARVCDDLVGCCGIVCMMEELLKGGVQGHVIGMFDRGEEVGFAGVIAACENGWVPGGGEGARVIGLETSKGGFGVGAVAPQGNGPVVRVGDRTGIFSAGLTHFIMQAAGFISDEEAGFKVQRKLMDGGMCNTTAFVAYGFDAAGMTLPIGGYHNMNEEKGFLGREKGAAKIVREWIHLGDFCGMVRVLVEVVKRYGKYKAGFGEMRERLSKMHREEQGMLWERKMP